MAIMTVTCGSCGQVVYLVSGRKDCPKCGAALPVPGAAEQRPPILDAQPVEAAPAPVISLEPVGPPLPERMKANKVIAGRNCPACSKDIELGDDVWNCQTCYGSMHQACRETAIGCGNQTCAKHHEALAAQAKAAPSAKQQAPAGDLMDCKYCGEKILKTAKKCKFCGEYQGAIDRARQDRKKALEEGDENLTGGEIAFGILCGGIACIMAVVWIIQGKPKGWKLLGIAIVTQLIFAAIRVAAGV